MYIHRIIKSTSKGSLFTLRLYTINELREMKKKELHISCIEYKTAGVDRIMFFSRKKLNEQEIEGIDEVSILLSISGSIRVRLDKCVSKYGSTLIFLSILFIFPL